MDVLSFLVPVAYIAALVWAVGWDFLRAQFAKDLETPAPLLPGLLRAASLPTLCLVGALLLRLLIHAKGLLLTALLLASAIATLKMGRDLLLRHLAGSTAVAISSGHRGFLSR